MKAVVLAAGVGRRLRPFTDLLPKSLLPIRGTPVLETLLRGLSQIGVREVCVVVGHLGDRVRAFAGDGSSFGVRVSYAEQAEPRGTGHALLQAASFIDDTVMVLAGDTAFGIDHLRRLRAFHGAQNADVSLCLKRVSPEVLSRTSSVAVTSDGRVTDMVEKPPLGEAPGELGCGLLHIHGPVVLDYLSRIDEPPGGELVLTDAIRAMISAGLRVMGLELETPPDLTHPRDLLVLNFDYARHLVSGEPDPDRP
jgi:NDP-sugar pyrophosphorylase family protein